jgi:5-methylthioadenosine/S-adenosylhomocysteine deaminase
MDLVINNAWILTLKNNKLGIIKEGAIGIEADTITYVGPSKDLNYKQADILIDGTKHVVMPGMVNSHIHTSMQLLRGGAQDLPEIEWMNKGIGPLAKHLTKDDIILGSKIGVLEGIRTGTTTFSEYTSNVEDLVEKIYLKYGARVVATETINEVAQRDRSKLKPADLYEFDKDKGDSALKRNEDIFMKYKDSNLVSCLYGPQALDMVSLDTLYEIKRRAIENNSRIHMHVAQGERERIQIEGRFGKESSTIKILKEKDFLGDYLIAVHCHDTKETERELMVNEKVKMIGCPSSISMIDGIIPPIFHYTQLGGDVGIGTDQAPGPGNHNLFREMRTISLLTKTMMKDPTILPAWEMLHLVTSQGAQVLGLEKKIGTLEVGKKADIITFNLNNILLTPIVSQPFHNFIPNIVYSATGTEIDNVIINGEIILQDSNFVKVDEQKLIDEANVRGEEIYNDAKEDWINADSKMAKDVKRGLL